MTNDLVPVDRLGPALVAATGDQRWSSFTATLISGGKSNLTFALRSAQRPEVGDLVLRRPPTGELLPSAHNMLREARVQQALADTPIPTAPIVLVDEGDLIGIQCYVMGRVDGHVIRAELPPAYADEPDQRRAIGEVFADTLAALHAIEPDAIGLGDYGRPDGFLARQIRRWSGQWDASKTHDVAEIDELGRRLAAAIPTQRRASIIHGDYRLDNVVMHPTRPDRIEAVLDWELSTLGDPMTDLGLLLFFWRSEGESDLALVPGVSHLSGFPTRDEMLARYVAASDADVTDLDWHLAFAHFKFAIIAQGVSARSRAGAMGGQDFGDLDDLILGVGREGLTFV